MGLLRGLDPLLTADLLYVLRAMGHGDQLCVCDCNFPAAEVASRCIHKTPIVLAGVGDLTRALEAICSVLPLDHFQSPAAVHMAPQEGQEMPDVGKEVISSAQLAIRKHNADIALEPCDRFAFYAKARKGFAVVQTMERRPYGNVLLIKGVLGPDGKDLKPLNR